ncbi:response regulator [Aliikangiella sp. IMCC44359]|uniref:response regulator n=1 Tax=Aliikangiella sp. IMCC44359 TaxID=3459125 RepID=UPI00403AAB57
MNKIKPVSILLVEDNLDHAELMIDACREFNIKNAIYHVTDGLKAIAYLRNEPPYENKASSDYPNIIFLDLKMPGQDGLTTLKIIKEDEKLKHIPVVMVSTSKTEPEILSCYSLGACGYVSKPLQFEEFSRKIKELNYYWILTAELPPKQEGI